MTCSRCSSARSHSSACEVAQNDDRYRYGPKKCTWPVAYSFGQRRGAAAEVSAGPGVPGDGREKLSTVCPPERGLAILMAVSFASAPPFVRSTSLKPPHALEVERVVAP